MDTVNAQQPPTEKQHGLFCKLKHALGVSSHSNSNDAVSDSFDRQRNPTTAESTSASTPPAGMDMDTTERRASYAPPLPSRRSSSPLPPAEPEVASRQTSTMMLGEEKMEVNKNATSIGAVAVVKSIGSVLVNVPLLLQREYAFVNVSPNMPPHLVKLVHDAVRDHAHDRHDDSMHAMAMMNTQQSTGSGTTAQLGLTAKPMDSVASAAAAAHKASSTTTTDSEHNSDDEGEIVVRMVVMAEQPVITTRLVPVEEIIVRRRRVAETKQVEETLRREVLDVHDEQRTKQPLPVRWHLPHELDTKRTATDGANERDTADSNTATATTARSTAPTTGSGDGRGLVDEQGRMVTFAEALSVIKERVPVGQLSAEKSVQSEKATASVTLTHDTLHVVRRALAVPPVAIERMPTAPIGMASTTGSASTASSSSSSTGADGAPLSGVSGASSGVGSAQSRALASETQVVQVMREQEVITKHVVPTEEVVVRRDVVREQQRVRSSVGAETVSVTAVPRVVPVPVPVATQGSSSRLATQI